VKTAVLQQIYGPGASVSGIGDVVHGDKASISAGRDVKGSTVGDRSDVPRMWFAKHPWWSALIVGVVVAIPGTYLTIWGL
jgi:hypothetical protein